jgi:hypothetical protein
MRISADFPATTVERNTRVAETVGRIFVAVALDEEEDAFGSSIPVR